MGCGGFLSKLKKQYDSEIDVVAHMKHNHSLSEVTVDEFKTAMSIINVNNVEFLGHKPRYFHEEDENFRFFMAKNRDNNYDLVLCPSSYDNHQDHQVINQECFRGLSKTTILGYEMLGIIELFLQMFLLN